MGRASDVVGGNIGSNNLQHRRLDIIVGDALDVAVAHRLVPDLQGLRASGGLGGAGREGDQGIIGEGDE